jgi:hypothetical protein
MLRALLPVAFRWVGSLPRLNLCENDYANTQGQIALTPSVLDFSSIT